MGNNYYDNEDYGVKIPSYSGEDLSDLEREEKAVEDGIPDVWWADDIRKIENPVLREQETEAARKLLEAEEKLIKRADSGEIDSATFEAEYFHKLLPKKSKAATRAGIESTGLSWDHLGDLAEDNRFLAKGDTELLDQKDRLKEMIEKLGPDASQELADEMLEDGRISEEAHETISRQVRLRRVSSE
jgi:hypothetical protein